MFRHHGKSRTLQHNLKIASLLSFVAGMVNVGGFLAIQQLTTNVTGHFAYLMDEVIRLNFWKGFIYFLYIFFFFLGAFVSGFVVESGLRKTDRYIFLLPALAESVLLLAAGFWGNWLMRENPNLLAFALLFAMGMQNSLVTSISNATVRTTHLTGLFTDLGIELSQLFFYRETAQRAKLFASVRLRLRIISFFFTGGVFSGIVYTMLGLKVLSIAGVIVLAGIYYDSIKLKILQLKRRNIEKP